MSLVVYTWTFRPLGVSGQPALITKPHGRIICPMPGIYTTPPHLQPVALWRLQAADGRIASATLAPTASSCAVAWDLDEHLQDAAQFPTHEAAVAWADDMRERLTATIGH